MLRDLHRSPTLHPEHRRRALQQLAIILSGKDVPTADEGVFLRIIDDLFKSELRRLSFDDRRNRREELFQDLRSSATLTRTESGSAGWLFSHNSLREYLVVEALVARAIARMASDFGAPISSAMRAFVASLHSDGRAEFLHSLRDLWQQRGTIDVGEYVSLAWDLIGRSQNGLLAELYYLTGSRGEGAINLSATSLDRVEFTASTLGVDNIRIIGEGMTISNSTILDLNLEGSRFDNGIFDRVVIKNCCLKNCSFRECMIFECYR
jgi:hypothetical protein